ncbi:hypothetical protein [Methylocapsa aurea]|uniref:hypothetical protein n=1 Tax=Methylocapsa aurea TaxID=663610 RepID=UPI003D18DDD9
MGDQKQSAGAATPEADPLEKVRRRVAKKLTGFTSDFPADLNPWTMSSHRPARQAFPVPELVLFMLRNLMGWQWEGYGEKVRWTVYGSVGGEPVGFALRKFGFTILRMENPAVPESRIIGQLQTALREVETFLTPFAEAQVNEGDVLIVNRFSEFDGRYQFFRRLAEKAYLKAKTPPRQRHALKSERHHAFSHIIDQMNHSRSSNREGFFHSTAMVDSYFSALEHRLVLLRAFTGTPLAPGELEQVLASKWDDKLKAVLPIAGDKDAELLLGTMRRIKERIRNPFAHGGVENDRGSLFFHLPQVGAIPANFSRFGDSVRFSFVPIEPDDHSECCTAFDELDKLLSRGPLSGPHRLMEAGIDPSFDAKSLKDYANASADGAKGLELFIHRWSHEWERHANMDY